ncbi:MAG TPA: TolC family protein [Desulfobacteraceae bacterium]|nr:TolC family protein [Desulfobacteraceae bacterium]
MKHLTGLISTILLLTVSQALADYGRMTEEFNAYHPPAAFLSPQGVNAATDSMETKQIGPDDPGDISAVKERLEKRLDVLNRDRVADDVYERISRIAGDAGAVETLVSERIRLAEAKALALLRNPGILAARKKVYGELRAFDQVMHLDDSLKQYGSFTRSLAPKVGPVKGKDSIKMTFPLPGMTGLKGRVVENQVALMIEQVAVTGKNVLKGVEDVYWDLVFIQTSIRITHDTISAFERLREVATALYRSGRTSFQDIIKINIKLEELKEDLITLASRKKTASVRLMELLDLPSVTPGRVETAQLPARLPAAGQLYGDARKHRQELKALRFRIEKVSAMVEMAETMVEARPTLDFSAHDADFIRTAGSGAPKAGFSSKTMAAMKNNSPVRAWYGINEPWLQQTRQTLDSLKNKLRDQENATDRLVRAAWFKADKNLREHALYKKRILPLAKSALDVSTREYEAGSIPFSQAIDSHTYWLKVQLTIARKRSDYGSAFAELETVTGKPLR